jgi:hypothetical protein
MGNKATSLVINYIVVEPEEIVVGATDNERWRWDLEDGESGADAKTLVFVTLTENGTGYAVSENAGFHCAPGAPERPLAVAHLQELFEVAWEIRNLGLNQMAARKKYFGLPIPPSLPKSVS